MKPFKFRPHRARLFVAGVLVSLFFWTAPTPALIMTGNGNAPVSDAGWPTGALAVANLKTRVGWYEGPPFGGGQWVFQYRGGIDELNAAIKAFAGIRAPTLQIVIHDGPANGQFLADPKDPKADTHYDWSFDVWVPGNWHRLFNDPRTTFMADSPNFRNPVAAPRLDIYVTDKIDYKRINLPAEGVQVTDERAATKAAAGAGAKAAAAGATVRGDVYDMATGKPIVGVDITISLARGPKNEFEKAATGTSDAVGRFELTAVPAGTCRIVASAPGYASRSVGYYEELKDGVTRKFNVELCAATTVSGTVVGPDGKPVPAANVRVDNPMGLDGRGYAGGTSREAKTDDGGKFSVADVPAGYFQLHVHAKGFYHVDPLKTHATFDARTLDVRMVTTGTVKGTIVDAKGKPAKEGFVNINPPGGGGIGSWGGSMNTKPDGTFQFDGVPPGAYVVSTKPQIPGAAADPNAQTITVEPGKTNDLTLKK